RVDQRRRGDEVGEGDRGVIAENAVRADEVDGRGGGSKGEAQIPACPVTLRDLPCPLPALPRFAGEDAVAFTLHDLPCPLPALPRFAGEDALFSLLDLTCPLPAL